DAESAFDLAVLLIVQLHLALDFDGSKIDSKAIHVVEHGRQKQQAAHEPFPGWPARRGCGFLFGNEHRQVQARRVTRTITEPRADTSGRRPFPWAEFLRNVELPARQAARNPWRGDGRCGISHLPSLVDCSCSAWSCRLPAAGSCTKHWRL